MKQLSHLAKSQQGKELLDKAKTFANDPDTRKKIDEARDKLNGHVETAKQKMADKKAQDDKTRHADPATAEAVADAPGPAAAAEPAHNSPPPAPMAPPAPDTTPPAFGDEGPKAA